MRRIVSVERQAVGGGVSIDSYFDRIIKYIPADVVCAWVAVTGLIAGSNEVPKTTLLWVMFVVLAVITMAWTLKQTAAPGRPPAVTQVALAPRCHPGHACDRIVRRMGICPWRSLRHAGFLSATLWIAAAHRLYAGRRTCRAPRSVTSPDRPGARDTIRPPMRPSYQAAR